MLRRVRDRSYLITTALVYAAIAVLFLLNPLGIHQTWPIVLTVAVPGYMWGSLFAASTATCLFGVFRQPACWHKVALAVAASAALGLAVVFGFQALAGQLAAIVPTIVWGYISCVHIIMSKYHDPHVIELLEQDMAQLRREFEVLREDHSC